MLTLEIGETHLPKGSQCLRRVSGLGLCFTLFTRKAPTVPAWVSWALQLSPGAAPRIPFSLGTFSPDPHLVQSLHLSAPSLQFLLYFLQK